MDLAVGIIRGAASTAIVSSLVDDPINSIIGLFTGGIDVTGLTVPLTDQPDGAAFDYGTFLMALPDGGGELSDRRPRGVLSG